MDEREQFEKAIEIAEVWQNESALYRYMLEVAKAAGFSSITDAITVAKASRAALAATQSSQDAFVIRALVAAGHVTQQKVDEAYAIACDVLPATQAEPIYQERMALNGNVWADVPITEYRERLDTDGSQWVRIVYAAPVLETATQAEPVAEVVDVGDGLGTTFIEFLVDRSRFPVGTKFYAAPESSEKEETGHADQG